MLHQAGCSLLSNQHLPKAVARVGRVEAFLCLLCHYLRLLRSRHKPLYQCRRHHLIPAVIDAGIAPAGVTAKHVAMPPRPPSPGPVADPRPAAAQPSGHCLPPVVQVRRGDGTVVELTSELRSYRLARVGRLISSQSFTQPIRFWICQLCAKQNVLTHRQCRSCQAVQPLAAVVQPGSSSENFQWRPLTQLLEALPPHLLQPQAAATGEAQCIVSSPEVEAGKAEEARAAAAGIAPPDQYPLPSRARSRSKPRPSHHRRRPRTP